MDQPPRAKPVKQLPRPKQKGRISGPAKLRLGDGEGFIDEKAVFFEGCLDFRDQGTVKVSEDQDGPESILGKPLRPCLKVQLPGLNGQPQLRSGFFHFAERGFRPVAKDNAEAALGQKQAVSPFTAGKVQDRAGKGFIQKEVGIGHEKP